MALALPHNPRFRSEVQLQGGEHRGVLFRLRDGTADLPGLQAQAERLGAIFFTDLDANAAAINPRSTPRWSVGGLVGVAVGTILVAILLGIAPALVAARSRPANLLRVV